MASKYTECQRLMCARGIRTRKDFLRWALKGGHPNKGGNTKMFASISDCNDKGYYCTGPIRRTPPKRKTPPKAAPKTQRKKKTSPKPRKRASVKKK